MELNIKDRIAFITGASRGIGAIIAEAYAAEGMHLALFGRDVARCEALAKTLKSKNANTRIAVIELDFEKPPSTVKTAMDTAIQKLGGIDVLVNCAGGAFRGDISEISDETWEKQFAVKPFGLVRMTREAIPHLKKSDQGRIINVSGTRGREPEWFSVLSGPINAGTLSITKALAIGLGQYGITVNAICPGSTDTRRWTETIALTAKRLGISSGDAKKHLLREVPMGRVVMPKDISDLAVFLASSCSGMITGSSINVDGGRTRSI